VATEYEALMKYSAYTITIKPVAEEALAGDGRVTLANDKVVSYKLIVSDGQTRFEVRLFGKIL
jgi:hypothetical protein